MDGKVEAPHLKLSKWEKADNHQCQLVEVGTILEKRLVSQTYWASTSQMSQKTVSGLEGAHEVLVTALLAVQLMSRFGWSLFTTAQRLRQATPCPAFSMTSVSELWLVTLNPMHSFSQILEIWRKVWRSLYIYECQGWRARWTLMKLMLIWLKGQNSSPEVQQDNLGHQLFETQEPPSLN